MANHTSILPSFFPSLIWMILLITATIIMARAWLSVTYRGRSGSAIGNIPQDVPVIRRPILTISEAKFFRALREAVGLQYIIFPQLSLWTMIDTPVQNRKTSTAFRNRINLKRVDFVLADPATLEPCMVIELDDRSHEREDRMKRDAFVASVLDRAGITLMRIRYPRCTARTGSETSWVLPPPKNDQPNRLEVSRTVREAGVIPISSFLYAPYDIRIVQSHLPQAFDRLSSLKGSGSSLSNYGLCDNLFTGFGHHIAPYISVGWMDGGLQPVHDISSQRG